MSVIEISGLRKEYRRVRGGRTVAVDGLDLSVPVGGVFGFLGPNGAGKTTTIRCLLGLVRPSGGQLRLLDADVERALPSVIGQVGSIVEAPAMFPRFSGRRNLEILARIHGEGASATGSGSATARRTPCVPTRWACASASRSRRRCYATRRC
jgi:ABC-2 type transport system ATP-binding protein